MAYTSILGSDQNANCAVRPLDNIAEMADEAARCAEMVEGFLDRFRGGKLVGGSDGPTPVPSGYEGQMNRLRGELARLDKLCRELSEIG